MARWIAAFNVRDLGGMLACAHPEISFQPLETTEAEPTYLGHAGVRRWLEEQDLASDQYQLAPERFGAGPDAEVIAVGAVRLPNDPTAARICGVHWLWDGLIIKAEYRYAESEALRPVEA